MAEIVEIDDAELLIIVTRVSSALSPTTHLDRLRSKAGISPSVAQCMVMGGPRRRMTF